MIVLSQKVREAMPTKVKIGPNESRDVQVISSTELTADYAGGWLGPCDVTVETSAGSTTAPNAFNATPHPPTITSVTPNAGPGNTRVTIRGSGFEA